MKSAGIHLLNQYSFRHTQPFAFLDKSTGPILPFMVLALCLSAQRLKVSSKSQIWYSFISNVYASIWVNYSWWESLNNSNNQHKNLINFFLITISLFHILKIQFFSLIEQLKMDIVITAISVLTICL